MNEDYGLECTAVASERVFAMAKIPLAWTLPILHLGKAALLVRWVGDLLT